jgi:hypothetical protein
MVVAVTRTSGAYSAKARMGPVAKFLAQFGTRALCLKEPLRFLKERCRKVVYFGHLTSLCSSLDFSNSINLWRRMKPATAVCSGNKGKFDRVGALWFEVRGLRVRRRAVSRNASPGGRAPSLGAAERHLVFARACGSGGVEGPPQIQISHFEFDLVGAA